MERRKRRHVRRAAERNFGLRLSDAESGRKARLFHLYVFRGRGRGADGKFPRLACGNAPSRAKKTVSAQGRRGRTFRGAV